MEGNVVHPEVSWWVLSVPMWLTIATVLLGILLLRARIGAALHSLLVRWAMRHDHIAADPNMRWTPPVIQVEQLFVIMAISLLGVLLALLQLGGMFPALLLAAPAMTLIMYSLLWFQEARYIDQLDHALPAATARLAAQLAAGGEQGSFQGALKLIVEDLPAGPLRAEWQFLIDHIGTPLQNTMPATPQMVVGALAAQTPSSRHRSLLGHVEMGLEQTKKALMLRMQKAAETLHVDEQRRSEAKTELSHMRVTGFVVGLAALGLHLFLLVAQTERFFLAFQNPLGKVVGVLVVVVALTPIVAGILLARSDDIDY